MSALHHSSKSSFLKASEAQLTPLCILLIEDDEGDRDLALEYLKGDRTHAYQVIWAPSLEIGLEKLAVHEIDAIILDLVLPDSRGVATVAKLCAQSQGIPVIVSSYFDENALADKVIELGAQDYLAKDIMDSQTLGRTLSRSLARAKQQARRLSTLKVATLPKSLSERKRTIGPAAAQTSKLENTQSENTQSENTQLDPSSPNLSPPMQQQIQQLQVDIQQLESVANDINQAIEQHSLDEVRQRTIATLSRECRSPLTVILLATGILNRYEKEIEDEQYSKAIVRINQAVRSMTQLLDNALNFHQMPTLMEASTAEPIDLRLLSQQVILKLKASMAPDSMPDIETVYLREEQPVYLYRSVLTQILTQLLVNAIQYSKDAPIVVTIGHQDRQIYLQVKDQGFGIPTADQSKVFEAFYRTNAIANVQGTGLGLTIVKTCTEMCGGQVSLESRVNEGTTVTVTLPESSY